MDAAADAAVVISVSPAFLGTVKISCQQTSAINSWLKLAQNLHQTAVANGTSADWGAMVLSFQNIVTGDQNTCEGVTFTKKPPLPFGSKSEYLEWTLMAADIKNQ
jgi:hypothetical protein